MSIAPLSASFLSAGFFNCLESRSVTLSCCFYTMILAHDEVPHRDGEPDYPCRSLFHFPKPVINIANPQNLAFQAFAAKSFLGSTTSSRREYFDLTALSERTPGSDPSPCLSYLFRLVFQLTELIPLTITAFITKKEFKANERYI
uniref:Uncharacterized protein n=1 Tax=Picea glauca TaxID=3330 RepID=A0A117NHN9_PICGL|nr:hypothetical protein ABT39_MTgene4695 [Picea glauca]QHR90959.1 hypothetical protein Q903MT_gene4988 [Picea sitchensis]